MELFLYLIPDTKRKKEGKFPWREKAGEKQEVTIADKTIWMWQIPFTKEELEQIQESFWKRKLFSIWISYYFGGKIHRKLIKQLKCAWEEKRFEDFCTTAPELRILYALYYLLEEYEWKKETKWMILCGKLLDGEELLDFLSYFLEKANCVFVYKTELSQLDLDSLWEESGLVVTKTKDLKTLEECDLILDAGENGQMIKKYLGKSGTYIDLTEERIKRRLLLGKSGKIRYISLGNYLDRAFQSKV